MTITAEQIAIWEADVDLFRRRWQSSEDIRAGLVAEVERLRAEVELWKDRTEAERLAHETTIKQYEQILSQ